MMLMSRAPMSENCNVRGIGVADMVSVSTLVFIWRSFSFTATPNFCSSSIISRPRSFHFTCLPMSLWVPMSMSMRPCARSSSTCRVCLVERARERYSTLTGSSLSLLRKVWKCWNASTVVGTSTATCLESQAALKAARIATSVLPKPTSPHTRRSIGRARSMSDFTSLVALSWSGVSS